MIHAGDRLIQFYTLAGLKNGLEKLVNGRLLIPIPSSFHPKGLKDFIEKNCERLAQICISLQEDGLLLLQQAHHHCVHNSSFEMLIYAG